MIFIDSMIAMYLVGRDPTARAAAQTAVAELIDARTSAVTSSEVFQEILHRYAAIRRTEIVAPAYDALLGIVDQVLPVTKADVLAARDLLLARTTTLSARDAVHAAVMQHHSISRILTFDRGFDQLSGIVRLPRP